MIVDWLGSVLESEDGVQMLWGRQSEGGEEGRGEECGPIGVVYIVLTWETVREREREKHLDKTWEVIGEKSTRTSNFNDIWYDKVMEC